MISIKLFSPTRSVSKYIYGLNKGFLQCDINSSIWFANEKPAFDLFAEEKFDVLFIEEENLKGNRALLKCLGNHTNIAVILKLPDNKEADLDLPCHIGNKLIGITTKEGTEKSAEFMGPHLIRYGADPDIYNTVNHSEKTGGFVYIGHPTKYVNSILSQICNPIGAVNIKLFTPADCAPTDIFPFSQYCGQLRSINEEKYIYSRADYGLDIAEPGQKFISEKIFELMSCNTEVITNNTAVKNLVELDELFPVIKSEGFNLDGFKVIAAPRSVDECFSLNYKDRAKQILELL